MFNGKRLSGWMALAVFATVGGAMVAADPAFAKVDVDKLTIGGEVRERYEVRVNDAMNIAPGVAANANNNGGNKGNVSQGSQRVRVNVGYDLTPDVTFFAQIQDARQFGTEGVNAGTTTGIQAVSQTNANQTGIDLHQGYIQIKNVLLPGLSLKAGRQEITFGDHRLMGNFGWSQVGNSFDGVRLTHSTGLADVDVFWARIFDNAATAFQAGNNNIPFTAAGTGSQSTTNQDLYGLYVTLKPVKSWTVEPYFFMLRDARQFSAGQTGSLFAGGTTSSLIQAQTEGQSRKTLGARINGKQSGLDFTAEGATQFGSITSACARTSVCGTSAGQAGVANAPTMGANDQHINGEAFAVKTGYTFEAVPMRPRLGFEFDYASGDKCANGPRNGDMNACGSSAGSQRTFDNLFPTNHGLYGTMDLQAWRNEVVYNINFDVKPSPASKLEAKYLIHRLANTADNWYRAGQAVYFASAQTNQAASLGQELDITYWHTFKEKFKFEIGFGHFFAGEYLSKSTGNLGNQFGCTQGSASNGASCNSNNQGTTLDQNWGYVMGSILF